jgi:hypothetical protein
MDDAVERIADYLAALDADVRDGDGSWEIELDSAGFTLNLELAVRGPLLRVEAAVLPPDLIAADQLLHWNRQAPLVCFASNEAGEVVVCGEIPLRALDGELLDRFLGLVLASATRAREFVIHRA